MDRPTPTGTDGIAEPEAVRSSAEFLRAEWRFLLFGLLVAFWSSPGQTFLISLFGSELRQEFGLSHGEFGGLYTLATLTSAAFLLPVGRLIDRLPLAVFTRWVVLGMTTAMFGFTLVSGPLTLFLGIFGLRFAGQGLMSHIAVTAMARRYRRERGRAVAVGALGHPCGEAIFPPLVVGALAAYEWRSIWIVLAALIAVTLLPAIPFLLRRTARQDGAGAADLAPHHDGGRHWTQGELLRDGRFYLLVPLMVAPAAIVTGVLFHQVHFVSLKGWSLEWWGASFMLYAAASVLTNLLAGTMVDRVGARVLAPLVLLPLAASMLLFGAADTRLAAPLVLGLMGASSGANGTVLSSLWAELYGTVHLGAIRALAAAIMVFASALGPVAMGQLLDRGATPAALMWSSSALVIAACAAAAFALRRTRGASASMP